MCFEIFPDRWLNASVRWRTNQIVTARAARTLTTPSPTFDGLGDVTFQSSLKPLSPSANPDLTVRGFYHWSGETRPFCCGGEMRQLHATLYALLGSLAALFTDRVFWCLNVRPCSSLPLEAWAEPSICVHGRFCILFAVTSLLWCKPRGGVTHNLPRAHRSHVAGTEHQPHPSSLTSYICVMCASYVCARKKEMTEERESTSRDGWILDVETGKPRNWRWWWWWWGGSRQCRVISWSLHFLWGWEERTP